MADVDELELVNAVLEFMGKEMPEVKDANIVGQFVYFFDRFGTMIAWTPIEAAQRFLEKDKKHAAANP